MIEPTVTRRPSTPGRFYRGDRGSVYLVNRNGIPINLETRQEGPTQGPYIPISEPRSYARELRRLSKGDSSESDLKVCRLIEKGLSELAQAAQVSSVGTPKAYRFPH